MCSFDCVCVIGIVDTKLLSSDKIAMQRRTEPHIKMTTAYAIRCVHKYIMLRTTQYWIHTLDACLCDILNQGLHYIMRSTHLSPLSIPFQIVEMAECECASNLRNVGLGGSRSWRTKGKTGTKHDTHRKWLNKTHSPIIIFYYCGSCLPFDSHTFRVLILHGTATCHIILNSATAHNGSQRLVGFHRQYGVRRNMYIWASTTTTHLEKSPETKIENQSVVNNNHPEDILHD